MCEEVIKIYSPKAWQKTPFFKTPAAEHLPRGPCLNRKIKHATGQCSLHSSLGPIIYGGYIFVHAYNNITNVQ